MLECQNARNAGEKLFNVDKLFHLIVLHSNSKPGKPGKPAGPARRVTFSSNLRKALQQFIHAVSMKGHTMRQLRKTFVIFHALSI